MLISTSSPAQTQFIKQSILHNIRVDGRNNWKRRTPTIKTNVLPHLPGSSYVYLQYENIQIYTGIKLKLQKVQQLSPKKEIALDLSTMRKLNDEDNDELSRLQSLLQIHFVDHLAQQEDLQKFFTIPSAKKHQIYMYIDVFLLSNPHIEQLELIQTGIKAALNSTTLSEISVAYNQVTNEQTTELSGQLVQMKIPKWSEVMLVGIVQDKQFVADLRKEQYEAMDTCFLITINEGKVIRIQSLKGTTNPDSINKAARFAIAVIEKNKN